MEETPMVHKILVNFDIKLIEARKGRAIQMNAGRLLLEIFFVFL
jgi:hypothetical protein